MKIKRLLCGLLFGLCATAAVAAEPAKSVPAGMRDATTFTEKDIKAVTAPPVLQRMVVGYQQNGDLLRMGWTLQRLSQLYPNSGDLRLAVAVNYAAQGDKTKAYDHLMKMKEQGFGYDISDDKRFEKIRGTKVWDYVVGSLQANLKVFGEGKVAFDLPQGDYLFETLAWDPKRERFLVGSVRDGQIRLADKQGKLTPFITPADGSGLWSVYALAVDAERDLLYAASTASVYFKGFREEDFGKSGVFKFQLSTGKLLDKYLLPNDSGARTLSSITTGKDGQVFVADGVRNEIYKIDGKALKLVVADPHLTSVRGLAVSEDGKTLYFADYTLGIFGADLAAGKGFTLEHNPDTLVLGGIDGLYSYKDTLVAIENGMSPKRVIRLSLSADGRSVAKVMPLDVANPAFELPTYGTVAGSDLYFIANSQKALYGDFGALKKDAVPAAVQVFRSNLDFAWNEGGIASGLKAVRQATPEESRKMLMTPPSMLDPTKLAPPPAEKKSDDKK